MTTSEDAHTTTPEVIEMLKYVSKGGFDKELGEAVKECYPEADTAEFVRVFTENRENEIKNVNLERLDEKAAVFLKYLEAQLAQDAAA